MHLSAAWQKGHGQASPWGPGGGRGCLWIELHWGRLALLGDKAQIWGVQKCEGTMHYIDTIMTNFNSWVKYK